MAYAKNTYWLIFLLVLSMVTAYYVAVAGYELYLYRQLSQETVSVALEPQVIKKSEESYLLKINYHFSHDGIMYAGVDVNYYSPFWNAFAAEKAAEKILQKPMTVYFSQANPHISALEKSIPFKSCFYALLLLSVQIYLFFISRSLGMLGKNV